MSKETGGPAFPLHNHGAQSLGLHFTGMDLRDYFAAKALPYCLKNCFTRIGACDESYDIADLMLEARKK